jgi:hypothetical protein
MEITMTIDKEIVTTCFICGKDVPDSGLECSNCHTRYCLWAHRKELNYKGILNGYRESNCLKCGQPIFGITSEKDTPETKEKAAKPTGFYIPTEKVPKECPSCGGSNISAILRPKIGTLERILDVVFGVLVIAALYYAFSVSGQFDDMNETITFILLAFGLWLGISYIWLGLTLRPIGRYLIAPKFETHATCEDCQYHWIAVKNTAQ